MTALILNSGIGARMGSLSKDRCKCMAKISNDVSIIDDQLTKLIRCGIADFIITTGPFADELESYITGKYRGVTFKFINNPNYAETNYIYSLFLTKEYLHSDFLLLHGDLIFEISVLHDVIAADYSVMVIDTTKPLPQKDFKAVIKDGKIMYIGVDVFDSAYYAQPLYKLCKKDWEIWFDEITRFCAVGNTRVYAENAFNNVSGSMNLLPFDIDGRYCFEIDNTEDLEYAKSVFGIIKKRKQLIYVGNDSFKKVQNIIASTRVKKVMVVCGSAYEHYTVPIKEFIESLPSDIVYFQKTSVNPEIIDIKKGIALFHAEKCDMLISIGGGSIIDTAKCINILSFENDDFMVNDKNRCNHIAIPTTAGTGSESTRFAVLYKNDEKLSFEHDEIMPDYVILEPGFLNSLRPYHKKSAVLDALCQSVESIWANDSTDESQKYAAKAIMLILNNAEPYLNGVEEASRLMLLAANLAGKAINISKTTAAHAMSYKLSTIFKITHGHAVSLCLPYVWEHLINLYENKPYINNDRLISSLEIIKETIHAKSFLESMNTICGFISGLHIQKTLEGVNRSVDAIVNELVNSVNVQRLSNHPVTIENGMLTDMYYKIVENLLKV